MSDVWQTVLAIIGSVGGAGVIITGVVAYCGKIIANRLEEKYSFRINKELEAIKADLEKKTYISKTKFDAEFSLYRELTKAFFDAVKAVSIMIPYGMAFYPADKEARKKAEQDNHSEALKATVFAQDTLKSNIPFISKEIYDLYADILDDCKMQLNVFQERWNVGFIGHEFGESTLETEDYQRTKTIMEKFDSLNEQVRKHIATLDVIQ